MEALYNLLISLGSPIIVGMMSYSLLKLDLRKYFNGYQLASLFFLTGYAFIGLLGTLLLGISPYKNVVPYAFILLGFSALVYFVKVLYRELHPSRRRQLKQVFSNSRMTILIALILVAGVHVIYANLWPILDWDALTLYDFRAKAFLQGMTLIRIQELVEMDYFNLPNYYVSYPPLTSLIHSWIYLLGGTNPLPAYAGFWIAGGLLLFRECNEKNGKSQWWMFALMNLPAFLILTSPILVAHSTMAYTNLPYAIFFLAASYCLLQYVTFGKADYLGIALLMCLAASMTRFTEPFYLTLILLAWLGSWYTKAFLTAILFTIIMLGARLGWGLVAYQPVSQEQIWHAVLTLDVYKIWDIWKFTLEHLLIYIKLPLLIALLCWVVGIRYITWKMWCAWALIGGSLLIFVLLGSYIFAVNNDYWQDIGGSVERMGIVFVPLLYLVCHDILIRCAVDSSSLLEMPRKQAETPVRKR